MIYEVELSRQEFQLVTSAFISLQKHLANLLTAVFRVSVIVKTNMKENIKSQKVKGFTYCHDKLNHCSTLNSNCC